VVSGYDFGGTYLRAKISADLLGQILRSEIQPMDTK
jgi:hypothetical protein